MRNIFGQEQHTRPLDGHFVHATVIPVGDRFYSYIEVGTEKAALYVREEPFDTEREAELDLRTQLRFLYETPLDQLRAASYLNESYDPKPFSLRQHREAAEEEGVFDTHVPTSITDPNPKLHYLSRRIASVVLEHYSPRSNLLQVDPKFYGAGMSGAERRRKMNDSKNWVDRAYFYDAGTQPEATTAGMHKYTAQLPGAAAIYDMAADPDQFKEQAQTPVGGLDLTVFERLIYNAGYYGFRNPQSALPNAVAVFYPTKVTRVDTDDSAPMNEPGSVVEPTTGEMLLTTVFVKRAGSTENYLQSLGVQPEVIQYVVQQPADVAKKLVNEVRKNVNLTLEQLQKMSAAFEQKQVYRPTPREIELANRYIRRANGMADWVFLQCKKYRKKKVGEEFEYNWPEGTSNGILTRAPGWSLSYIQPVFDQIGDWANATGVQLASYDLLPAKQASDKWHEEQTQKGAGNGYEESNVVATLSNGWTIQEVRTENDLEVEGNLMGHCVGSYCGEVTRGNSTIFSLRDPQNNPHVTIEVEGRAEMTPTGPTTTMTGHEGVGWDKDTQPGWRVKQIQGKGNAEPIAEYKKMIAEWFKSMDGGRNIAYGDASSIEDSIYNANVGDLVNILEGGSNLSAEYGLTDGMDVAAVLMREFRNDGAEALSTIYGRIIHLLRQYSRHEHRYMSRTMDPIAHALADLAWDIDIQSVNKVAKGQLPADWKFPDKGVWSSAMGGIHRLMDSHVEEFDEWGNDYGLRYPQEDDFATTEEYQAAEEKFHEEEAELRDESYREWLNGGMDMEINARWNYLAKTQNHGLYPWEVLDNVKGGREPYAPTERLRREQPNA